MRDDVVHGVGAVIVAAVNLSKESNMIKLGTASVETKNSKTVSPPEIQGQPLVKL